MTGVQADSADLDQTLNRLVRDRQAGEGRQSTCSGRAPEPARQAGLGDITEEHFDAAFSLNARGTLFTVQKALPLLNDGGSIIMTGSNASLRGYPGRSVVRRQQGRPARLRAGLGLRAEGQEDPGQRADPRLRRHARRWRRCSTRR